MHAIDRSKNWLVLFSGGMDSTISLFWALDVARKNGGRVSALSFSYGQRHSSELYAARKIIRRITMSDMYGPVINHHVVLRVHVPPMGSLTGGEKVTKYGTIQDAEEFGQHDNAFLPYRNLVFLSQAAMFAYQWDCGNITTGLRGGFADCTEEFESSVQNVINMAVPHYPLRIVTPTHLSREDCLSMASSLPGCIEALAHSLTCFEGTSPPCGQCLPCLKRAEGWAKSGMRDPITGPQQSGMGDLPRRLPRFD